MINILDLRYLGIDKVIASFLIETSEGPLLVETGPHSTYSNLESEVNKNGYDIRDIKHVFITHIHLDHAGAAWVLAQNGATVYLHPRGAKHMIDPSRLYQSARRIYQDEMERRWGDLQPIAENRLYIVDHEAEITVGNVTLKAWHTPGHAVHHIAWQLDENLFSGDVAGVKIDNGLVEAPCPPPDIDLEDWFASIDIVKRLKLRKIYLTHFGEVQQIQAHLEALKANLRDRAEWIRIRWERGESVEQVIPDFQKYVEAQLRNAGVKDRGSQRYEAANPASMSVTGLMRYWRKRSEE